jgi:hypothetical protein
VATEAGTDFKVHEDRLENWAHVVTGVSKVHQDLPVHRDFRV